MQSEIFQAFICYNCDDYGLQLMKTFSQYSNLTKSKKQTTKCIKNLK